MLIQVFTGKNREIFLSFAEIILLETCVLLYFLVLSLNIDFLETADNNEETSAFYESKVRPVLCEESLKIF